MHRTIEITVAPVQTAQLLHGLAGLEHVIGLSVHRGASLKPPGDVVIVHTLNRGADAVLRCAEVAGRQGPVSIVTSEVASIIDPAHAGMVDNDVDEAVWEEMETGLRHQGRITANYLVLMAMGGTIAAVGLVSDPVPQAIAFVSGAVIAPGFEPLVKIPLGLVLRRWSVVRRGLVSTGLGYAALMLASGLTFLLLRLTGATTVEAFAHNPEVERIAGPTLLDLLVSAAAAVAGITMVAAYRRSVIAGPLIALALIGAAATVGAAIAASHPELSAAGLRRLGIDVLLIIALGVPVLLIKQVTVHRRSSMV